eukprot:jgi/Tetstr1/441092/TSEL_029360.t1
MPPSAPDPLLYTLFKGSFAAAEAREPRHAAAARDAVLSWGSSSSAWSLLWRETGGRADYAPAAEVSSQATSCRQRRPVACTVDTFVQAAVNGGGGFLQVPTWGYGGGRGEKVTGSIRSRVVEQVMDGAAVVVHVEGLRGKEGGEKGGGEVLWERVLLWWWSSAVGGKAVITAWPVDHPDVPLRKKILRDREVLLIVANEQAMHENAGTVNTTIDIATINYLPKRFRFLSGGFRHDWARKRAQQLLLKLQEAMAAQQKPAAIGLGAMVSKIMGHTKGNGAHAEEWNAQCECLLQRATESLAAWEEIEPDGIETMKLAVKQHLEESTMDLQHMLKHIPSFGGDHVSPGHANTEPMEPHSLPRLFQRYCAFGSGLAAVGDAKLYSVQVRLQSSAAHTIFTAMRKGAFWASYSPVPNTKSVQRTLTPCALLPDTQAVLLRLEKDKWAMSSRKGPNAGVNVWRGIQTSREIKSGRYLVVIASGTALVEAVLKSEQMPASMRTGRTSRQTAESSSGLFTHIAFHIVSTGSHTDVTIVAVSPSPCLAPFPAMSHVVTSFEAGLHSAEGLKHGSPRMQARSDFVADATSEDKAALKAAGIIME